MMMNVYAVCISSLKSGDIEVLRTFSRYSRATSSLNEVIQKYITERGLTSVSRIIEKVDFSSSNVSKDKTFPNGYVFRKGKNSVTIYKKTTDVGYIKNTVTFVEEGKIGICDFDVKIPSKKLPRKSNKRVKHTEEIPSDDDCEIEPINKATNQEHGRYITMIEELKNVLNNRRNNMNLKSFEDDEEIDEKYDQKYEEEIIDPFLLNLAQVKQNLTNVPTPVPKIGYKIGKVIDTTKLYRSSSLKNLNDCLGSNVNIRNSL